MRQRCRFCGAENTIKYGKVFGQQRFLCRECGRQFVEGRLPEHSERDKFAAFTLAMAGIPKNTIGQLLQVSAQSVLRWIRKIAQDNRLRRGEYSSRMREINVIELVRYFAKKEKKRQAKSMWLVPYMFPSGWSLDLVLQKPAPRLRPEEDSPLEVSLMGDEILKGVVQDEKTGRYRILRENFAAICQERLNIRLHNLSKLGSTVAHCKRYFKRYRKSIQNSPYIFFLFGDNDCNFNWDAISRHPLQAHNPACTLDAFREKYSALIMEAKREGTMPVLLSLPPVIPERFFRTIGSLYDKAKIRQWLNADLGYIRQWQQMYNLEIFKIGVRLNVPVFDITTPFLQQRIPGDFVCADGVHPNAAGHRLIADSICGHIASLTPPIFPLSAAKTAGLPAASRRKGTNGGVRTRP